jgi:hypothetical protein
MKVMEAVGAAVLQGSDGAPLVDRGSMKALQHQRREVTVRAALNRSNAEQWQFSL